MVQVKACTSGIPIQPEASITNHATGEQLTFHITIALTGLGLWKLGTIGISVSLNQEQ